MGLENVNRCQHIKVNGTQCGSPALRRRRLCFFHGRCLEQTARILQSQFKQARYVVPVLEDANAVQLALMQVMQLLATGQMDHKTAGLMLYALQNASCNLRLTQFEPRKATDVVIDRSTVNATCIGGPQWFEDDFGVEEENEEVEDDETDNDSEDEAAVEEESPVAAQGALTVRAAKAVEHVSIPEARKRVQGLIRDWVVETVEGQAEGKPG
jgi:hypothetical protein